MTTSVRLLVLVPLCLSLVLVVGCKKKNRNARASVFGQVTCEGTPVPAGTITFHPKQGKCKYVVCLRPDGSYSTTDLPIGEMVVTVETESVQPKQMTEVLRARMAKSMGPTPDFARFQKAEYVKIPVMYSDPDTSPLQANLQHGKNDGLNFDLTE
jgi:hypothetical protein